MPTQTTNDTVTDIKLEHGVRRLQEMKSEKKKGRVTGQSQKWDLPAFLFW
jgi:hypothetical protein